ncbi:MAG: hypothetical protein V7782_14700 [Psychromonas sp.]
MERFGKELLIAETYIDEMLAADQSGDYDSFVRRFDKVELEEFNQEIFNNDVALMREELGSYKSRVYLGSLQGFQTAIRPRCLRFVWRAVYEKNEALIILGIHQVDGEWYVNESTVSK